MDKWIAALKEFARLAGGSLGDGATMWILIGVGAFVVLAMLAVMAAAVGSQRSSFATHLLALAVIVLGIAVPAAAIRVYALPGRELAGWTLAACGAGAAAGFFGLAVPVNAMVQKVKYLSSMVSLVIALVAGAGAIWGLRATVSNWVQKEEAPAGKHQPPAVHDAEMPNIHALPSEAPSAPAE